MSFAIVIEGMNLIVYIIILAGGKQKRESGWKFLAGLHMIVAALQVAAMAIIVSVLFWQIRLDGVSRWVGAYDSLNRHISMITTIASSLVGNWILHGSIALSAGVSSFCSPAVSAQRRYGCLSREDTS